MGNLMEDHLPDRMVQCFHINTYATPGGGGAQTKVLSTLCTLRHVNSFTSSAPFGLSQSAQGHLRVRPGASVPLGYGGMPTGVFISFAARDLPRLAAALRFPVPPGGPSERYRGVLKISA